MVDKLLKPQLVSRISEPSTVLFLWFFGVGGVHRYIYWQKKIGDLKKDGSADMLFF